MADPGNPNSAIKVCVGLSGGVDSSVAALLLKQQGYDVFAMFMQNWHDADATLHGDCEWEEDRFVAELVARKIGIPFYFVDLSGPYRQRVVDYMFDEYAKGRTPNPDVLCNREIKFDAFLAAAKRLGADFVATGHYVRKSVISSDVEKSPSSFHGSSVESVAEEYLLLEGVDPNKDQSYFLCQLSQEQLRQAMFPIGELTKPEVRRIAKEADLTSAEKKDSQGICFVGKVDLPTFLKQKLAPAPGDVVEVFPAWYEASDHYQAQKALLGSLLRPGEELEMTTYYAPEVKVLTSDGEPLGECPFDLEKLAALTEEELRLLATPEDYSGIQFETETYRSGKKHIKKTRWKSNPYGVIAGQHEGAQFYTVGQRKGLNIGGHTEPIFVIATDTATRRVYVGEGHAHPGLSRRCLRIAPEEVHWLTPPDIAEGCWFKTASASLRPQSTATQSPLPLTWPRVATGFEPTPSSMSSGESTVMPDLIGHLDTPIRCRVRIRYRQPLQSATLLFRPGGLYILFDKPQRGITPGQFAACYDGEVLFLSGVISE
ncbi:MAG: tRNA 2-thiouridine(34) synthase MnmA [Bacteroidota bacterium]|nr:tRNA 2-thiouridine(34) synthase MnmA [Bacteroidota bacterium]